MKLIEKYNNYPKNKKELLSSEVIVFEILDDINNRSGLGNAWDDIDSSTKNEIIKKWLVIVKKTS